MQRQIRSFSDIAPAYKELPNYWKLIFWFTVIGIAVLLIAWFAFQYYQKTASKLQRDAKVAGFASKLKANEKKAAKLVKKREAIIKQAEKVGENAKKLMDAVDGADLTFAEQHELRRRINTYRNN